MPVGEVEVVEIECVEKIRDRWAVERHVRVGSAWTGFGKLSRLRPVIGGRFQLRSMNLRSETWSA